MDASAASWGLASGCLSAAAARWAPVHWPVGDGRTWLASLFAAGLAYDALHRANHEVRRLWTTHAVHHSPEAMTMLPSTRLGWTNLLSFGWVCYRPLLLAGFGLRLLFALLAFSLRYPFFLHTAAVGWLEPAGVGAEHAAAPSLHPGYECGVPELLPRRRADYVRSPVRHTAQRAPR